VVLFLHGYRFMRVKFSNIADVLLDAEALAEFHAFLSKEWSSENLDFWLRAAEFADRAPHVKSDSHRAEHAAEAWRIYHEFIKAGGASELGLDYVTKNEIKTALDAGELEEVFFKAEFLVLENMRHNGFQRFVHSPELRRFQANRASKRSAFERCCSNLLQQRLCRCTRSQVGPTDGFTRQLSRNQSGETPMARADSASDLPASNEAWAKEGAASLERAAGERKAAAGAGGVGGDRATNGTEDETKSASGTARGATVSVAPVSPPPAPGPSGAVALPSAVTSPASAGRSAPGHSAEAPVAPSPAAAAR